MDTERLRTRTGMMVQDSRLPFPIGTHRTEVCTIF
jgi:hypothetical protein